jgi:hypothetical protein
MPKKLSKDDIARLSRGKSSQSRVGSRGIPHRLTTKERAQLKAAQVRGYLKIGACAPRENLVNIYRLWCEQQGVPFIVRTLEELSGIED